MMMSHSHHSRYGLCLLVFLALVVQAMIPLGFMPGQRSGKMVEIVICTASGFSSIMVDDAHEKSNQDQNHQSDSSFDCPYAPVVAAGMIYHSPVLPILFHETEYRLATLIASASDSRSKHWLSQAPPASLTHV